MSANDSKLILGIDLEGMNKDLHFTGVDVSTDRVIEIGAVLWDWNQAQPVKILSELVDEADRLPISAEVERVTGLNDTILKDWGAKGSDIHPILLALSKLMEKADYIMAHNGPNYDIPMLEGMFKRYDLEMPKKVWIDTMTDIEYPLKITGRSMALLEHSHGFINPFPHRAVTDVLSMLKIASKYPVSRMMKMAESPRCVLVAALKAPNWKDAKAVGEFNAIKNRVAKSRFKWNPKSKEWTKDVHKILIDEGKVNYDFEYFIKE
jgi:DNA polymerase-3 subunit epsilon